MVDVFTPIDIQRPVKNASDYAASPDHAPEWYVNINSAEWQTEKPLTVGSRIAFKAKFLGRDLSYVYEIAEFLPGQKLVMRTANGPFPMETTYTWEAINKDATRMTLRNTGNPTGFIYTVYVLHDEKGEYERFEENQKHFGESGMMSLSLLCP